MRFVLVLLPGLHGRERHSLPPEVSDAPATLCELPRPGRWSLWGFTVRLLVIDCMTCRIRAAACLPHAPGRRAGAPGNWSGTGRPGSEGVTGVTRAAS